MGLILLALPHPSVQRFWVFWLRSSVVLGLPRWLSKESTWSVRDLGSIPELGRSLEKGMARIRYSSLENFMGCIVHGVANSWTWLIYFHFQVAQWYKEPTCQCRGCKRRRFDPCLGRSPGVENGKPLQYFWLENSMGRGVLWAIVHGVSPGWTWLSDGAHRVQNSLAPAEIPSE